MMVGTDLAASACAALLPYATTGGDVDGGLLTTAESQLFAASFAWDAAAGRIVLDASAHGVTAGPIAST